MVATGDFAGFPGEEAISEAGSTGTLERLIGEGMETPTAPKIQRAEKKAPEAKSPPKTTLAVAKEQNVPEKLVVALLTLLGGDRDTTADDFGFVS